MIAILECSSKTSKMWANLDHKTRDDSAALLLSSHIGIVILGHLDFLTDCMCFFTIFCFCPSPRREGK